VATFPYYAIFTSNENISFRVAAMAIYIFRLSQESFTLSIRSDLFTQIILQAALISPGKESQAVPCEIEDNRIVLQISNLNTWGIMAL
jgi:hypothetical protein